MTDIYKAPEAELTDPTTPGQYGSVEKAIAGDYELKPVELIKEAWANLKGLKTTYWLASIIYVVIYVAVVFLVKLVTGEAFDPESANFSFMGLIGELIVILVMAPFGAGLFMIALKYSVGASVEVGELFKHFDKALPLFLMTVLYYLAVGVGLVLLIVPGIYLMFALIMAAPLIIDKNMGVLEALKTSRKAVTHKWFSILGFSLLNVLVVFAGALALLVGLLWAVPLVMLAMAMLYRNMFGVEESSLNN